MDRRKGEISSARIDREFPYQVALSESQTMGSNYETVHGFCRGLSAAPRTQHVIRVGPGRPVEHWNVFCFAVKAEADAFAVVFDGVPFDPKRDRGKGNRKRFWDVS